MSLLMDGLEAEKFDRVYTDQYLISRMYRYFKPRLGLMQTVGGLVVINALVEAALPIALAQGIDTLSVSCSTQTIVILIEAILAAGVLSWITNYIRQWQSARLVGDVVLEMQKDTVVTLMNQDMSFYDTFSSGKIVSRVTSDTEAFATVVTLVLNLMSEVLLVILIMIALFYINVHLALLTLTVVPLIIGSALAFRHITRSINLRTQRALARLNANVQEVMSGITVAKSFRQEATVYSEFKYLNEQQYQLGVRTGMLYNSIFSIMATLTGISTVLVIYYGGNAIINRTISAGAWFLFVQSVTIFWRPLTNVTSFWSLFQQGLAAGERIFALIDTVPSIVQYDQQPINKLNGKIEFQHIDFRYSDQEVVLEDFNLTIAPGETVALVGHTGAGKSTLGKLIMRFYEYQHGSILVDGQDIRTFDLRMYRRRLGVVSQIPFLFDGTIGNNIRYACPEATDAEVLAVARRIGNGEWLEDLPLGLQTPVGESGKRISLGQRQIVALCRILLQDPAIVILDEATASVDPLTEAQLQTGLDVVLAGRTAIIIAHRLSTIIKATRIIVLEHGKIIEEGCHGTLLLHDGPYAHLYNTYFRHQSPDYQPM